jgi:hypothetical protein
MKKCTKCWIEKKFGDFYKSSRSKDGYMPSCKTCADTSTKASRAKKKDHYNKLRNNYKRERYSFIAEAKQKTGCAVCGEREVVCLDFHHLDPSSKDFALANAWGFGEEKLRAEMDKCVVVCKNCHAKIHAGLINLPL